MEITLSAEDANRLRDAIREERKAKEALEAETLRCRLVVSHAITARAVVFDELADKYGFDSFAIFDFDWASKKLSEKKEFGHGPTA